MQGVVDNLRGEGFAGVWIVSVNQFDAAPFLDQYIPNVDGPVFQDVEGNPILRLVGATTYNVWLVDRRGRVRYRHASANLPADEALFTEELRTLASER